MKAKNSYLLCEQNWVFYTLILVSEFWGAFVSIGQRQNKKMPKDILKYLKIVITLYLMAKYYKIAERYGGGKCGMKTQFAN